jgi:hypothetical protein
LRDDLVIAQLTLTAAERLILTNQYAILERLYPKLRREYAARRRIVEQSAVEHYDALLSQLVPTPGSGATAELSTVQSPEAVPHATSFSRPDSTAATGSRVRAVEPKRTARPDRDGALTPW